MEKIKAILDREKISTEQIEAKQDFDKVLKLYNKSTSSFYKSPWFYGPIGLATIGTVFALTTKGNIVEDQNELVNRNEAHQLAQRKTELSNKNRKADRFAQIEVVQLNNRKAKEATKKEPIKNSSIINDQEAYNSSPLEEVKKRPVSTIPVEKLLVKRKNTMPSIAGVYTGDVLLDELFDKNGIVCNDEMTIKSFSIRYQDGESERDVLVYGQNIPVEIQASIVRYNMNSMIFITDIRAIQNQTGKEYLLSSMHFIPVNKR